MGLSLTLCCGWLIVPDHLGICSVWQHIQKQQKAKDCNMTPGGSMLEVWLLEVWMNLWRDQNQQKTKEGCFHIMKQYNGLMSCMDAIVLEMDSYIHKNNQSHEKVGKIIYCCLMQFLHPAVCVFLTLFCSFCSCGDTKGKKAERG